MKAIHEETRSQHVRAGNAAHGPGEEDRQADAKGAGTQGEKSQEGLKPETHPAVERVQALAVECLTPEAMYGLATDIKTFNLTDKKKPPAGLLAVAIAGIGSVVIAIDMTEWLAAMTTTMEEAGYSRAPPRSAMERLKK